MVHMRKIPSQHKNVTIKRKTIWKGGGTTSAKSGYGGKKLGGVARLAWVADDGGLKNINMVMHAYGG